MVQLAQEKRDRHEENADSEYKDLMKLKVRHSLNETLFFVTDEMERQGQCYSVAGKLMKSVSFVNP